jgi:CheY-like chemotaxis protein
LLLVDDQPTNTRLLGRLLERLGFIIESRSDGQQAVDVVCAEPHRFSAILMDNNMPVLCGMEATAMLRSRGHTLPIIGVTGDTMPEERALFLQSGANEVVPKPVQFPKLLEIIKALVMPSANVAASVALPFPVPLSNVASQPANAAAAATR